MHLSAWCSAAALQQHRAIWHIHVKQMHLQGAACTHDAPWCATRACTVLLCRRERQQHEQEASGKCGQRMRQRSESPCGNAP